MLTIASPAWWQIVPRTVVDICDGPPELCLPAHNFICDQSGKKWHINLRPDLGMSTCYLLLCFASYFQY